MGNFLLKKKAEHFILNLRFLNIKGGMACSIWHEKHLQIAILVTYIRFALVAAKPGVSIRLVRGNWCKALECKKCPEKCPLHWDAIQVSLPSKFTTIYTDKRGQHKN